MYVYVAAMVPAADCSRSEQKTSSNVPFQHTNMSLDDVLLSFWHTSVEARDEHEAYNTGYAAFRLAHAVAAFALLNDYVFQL